MFFVAFVFFKILNDWMKVNDILSARNGFGLCVNLKCCYYLITNAQKKSLLFNNQVSLANNLFSPLNCWFLRSSSSFTRTERRGSFSFFACFQLADIIHTAAWETEPLISRRASPPALTTLSVIPLKNSHHASRLVPRLGWRCIRAKPFH